MSAPAGTHTRTAEILSGRSPASAKLCCPPWRPPVNTIVFPPYYEGPEHYHDTQDELYFVHKGRIRVDVGGESRELAEGGLFHASSTTPRRISNVGDEDAIVYIVGGRGGYVERDGHLVDPEVDLPRRQGLG